MGRVQPPLWWSWLWWPTTLLLAAVCSCLYLFFTSEGLDKERRFTVVAGGAVAPGAAALLFYLGASNICANGASLRVEPWVLPAAGALWLVALWGLTIAAGTPPSRSWVAPFAIVGTAVTALWVESFFTLHTLSRHCDGEDAPLRLHTAISLAVPAALLALVGGAHSLLAGSRRHGLR